MQNITILGASGNIGVPIVEALLTHPTTTFNVQILTRSTSLSKTQSQFSSYPNQKQLTVTGVSSYLSTPELESAFKDQDCVICTLASFSTKLQHTIIDAAISAGVKRYLSSEYGVDTSSRELVERYLPVAIMKTEIVEYLISKQSQISWTAPITGAFFDWTLMLPGVLSWNLTGDILKADVFDGGDVKYEATNLTQIGRAVAACLSSADLVEKTKNQYVYVNSVTTTQNEVISVIEKYTGRKVERTDYKAAEFSEGGQKKMADSGVHWRDFEPTPEMPYPAGSVETIWAGIYGHGNLNHYSANKGLWNEVLGLPKETVEETVKGVVQKMGIAAN